jgi:glutathione S-transferase
MRAFDIPFKEVLVPMTDDGRMAGMAGISPTGKVPCLVDQTRKLTIWESVAITEYLAERHPELAIWPDDIVARATARALVAEMHAGFLPLRNECPMNLRRPAQPLAISEAAQRDMTRVESILADCLAHSAGPFLMGSFSALDAFYAPLLARIETYRLSAHPAVTAFQEALDTLPAWQEWQMAAPASSPTHRSSRRNISRRCCRWTR